ncbi:Alpha/beta hydrolase fold-1 [Aspergillus desertorum]
MRDAVKHPIEPSQPNQPPKSATPSTHQRRLRTTRRFSLVFPNGLGLPQTGWFPVIAKLKEQTDLDLPGILTYDRYGQGATTDRDPENPDAHDCLDVVKDLRQLLTQLTTEKLRVDAVDEVKVVFVADSIGCALARLYAQQHPGTVAGLVLLDSVLANSDFVSIVPDPDAAEFGAASDSLPETITPEILRATRARIRAIFHPVDGQGGKAEGLSRANLPSLLPHSDGPTLAGPGGRAEHGVCEPVLKRYNEGLVRITDQERAKGPVIAEGAGHFVQRDRPDLVVQEIAEILGKIYADGP